MHSKLILIVIISCIPVSLIAKSHIYDDRVELVHNDMLYSFTVSRDIATTTSVHQLINITDVITSNFDLVSSNTRCSDFKNYLFAIANMNSYYLAFGKSLFFFDSKIDFLTSITLTSNIKYLGIEQGAVIVGLCNGDVKNFDSKFSHQANFSTSFTLPSNTTAIEFMPKKGLIGICMASNAVRIVDTKTSEVKLETGGNSIKFMDKYALIRAASNSSWKIYDLKDFKLISSLDSKDIIVSSDKHSLFDLNNFQLIQNNKRSYLRRLKFNENVEAAAFSPDNNRLYILSSLYYLNADESDAAVYSVYKFELSSADGDGKLILQISGKPVYGHHLWVGQ